MKTKTALTCLLLLALALTSTASVRSNRSITVVAGTPVQLSTTSITVRAVFIQMAIGGTAAGYVMAGIPSGTTPSKATAAHVTAQLAPASATAPGSSYSDVNEGGIDLSLIWVDGDNSGDKIIVSYDRKN
jgi:hypothetical protein